MKIVPAVCAVALALFSGCSSEPLTEAGPAAPAASAVPSSAPADSPEASASTATKGDGAVLCEKVSAAKVALNEQLKQVASSDGRVPPAEGKKVMTGLTSTLRHLAASGDAALDALAAEASKAADAADPVRVATSTSFDAAGQKVDDVCAKA